MPCRFAKVGGQEAELRCVGQAAKRELVPRDAVASRGPSVQRVACPLITQAPQGSEVPQGEASVKVSRGDSLFGLRS